MRDTVPATRRPTTAARAAGWGVHALTASGVVIGMLALVAIERSDYRAAFLWMIAATAIDGVDGWLARAARVKDTVPHVDGARLDDIVDYLTYVFVPAMMVWHAGVVPGGVALPVVGAMLLASVFGFSRTDAKTADYFFTGFPSYWNIVVFYLMAGGLPPWTNAFVLVALAVMVFVPLGYVYPSRTPVLRRLSVAFGTLWAAAVLVLAWQWPSVNRSLLAASMAYPVYYVGLSLVLHARRGSPAVLPRPDSPV